MARRTVLWCRARGRGLALDGALYAPGLQAFGLDMARVLFAYPRGKHDLLWAMEEGLRCSALAGAVAEIERLDLTATRRLALAAETGGTLGVLLRRTSSATGLDAKTGGTGFSVSESGAPEPSAAVTRWRVGALPSSDAANRDWRDGLSDRRRWRVELLRSRGGRPASWIMEWVDVERPFGNPAAGGSVNDAKNCEYSIPETACDLRMVDPVGDRPDTAETRRYRAAG